MRSIRIYVAGPYRPTPSQHCKGEHDALRIVNQNIRRAIEAAIALIKLGHIPYVPHLNHYIHIEMDEDMEDMWLEQDFEWLRCCDAILLLPGYEESGGALKELELASELGLIEFKSVEEVETFSRDLLYGGVGED